MVPHITLRRYWFFVAPLDGRSLARWLLFAIPIIYMLVLYVSSRCFRWSAVLISISSWALTTTMPPTACVHFNWRAVVRWSLQPLNPDNPSDVLVAREPEGGYRSVTCLVAVRARCGARGRRPVSWMPNIY